MCGICGFVGAPDDASLQAMTDALSHRGPDGAGTTYDAATGAHLGHRRLSILDAPGGAQPLWNEDGEVGIVFNGEIYNHLELRKLLVAKGHVFRSDHSDTEVLVHGYEEWGDQLPAKLSGMFAFAILDRRRRRVFLARDRFGKKPLYYTLTPHVFAFASELGSLAKHPAVDTTIDVRSVKKFLSYSFLPAPNALYRGSRKLPGGHSMTYDIETRTTKIDRYWRFEIDPCVPPPDAERRWTDELRGLLSEAVRRRLMSDVPIGIFLSGGVDSSAVLALAARHLPAGSIQTFAIGFNEPSFDESSHARRTADHFGAVHHEQFVDLEQGRTILPDLLSRMDEPLGDPSILPTYLLSRFARKHITVALGGDGADELFAGYDPFKALKPATFYQRVVPRGVHAGLRVLADLLPISARNMSFDFKVRRALRGVSFPPALWNPLWLGALEPRDVGELFNEPADPEDLFSEALEVWNECGSDRLVDRVLEFYTRMYLQDDILVKLDRASMLNSLEARCPFLDNDLVDFVRRLPAEYKFRRGQTKYLLRRALKGIVPDEVLQRRKKGFGVPLVQWLREWPRGGDSPTTVLDVAWTRKRWDEHLAGRADHRTFLWCDLALKYHGGRKAA